MISSSTGRCGDEVLVAIESRDGHLSVTGPGGRDAGDTAPQFDQQPIEVAAIADAAARAFELTRDPKWMRVVGRLGTGSSVTTTAER